MWMHTPKDTSTDFISDQFIYYCIQLFRRVSDPGRLPGTLKTLHLKSRLLASSSGGMVHGRSCGRQAKTSSENSEKSTSYSIRMPSVSGSISPAWPRVLARRLYTHICPGGEKNNDTNVLVSKQKIISVTFNFSSKFYLPLSKVTVFWPVGDPTDKQCVGIVPWTGSEVSWTVGKWNVHPRNTMVHWGKHGKVLIWKELDEAWCRPRVLLLHNINHLKTHKIWALAKSTLIFEFHVYYNWRLHRLQFHGPSLHAGSTWCRNSVQKSVPQWGMSTTAILETQKNTYSMCIHFM